MPRPLTRTSLVAALLGPIGLLGPAAAAPAGPPAVVARVDAAGDARPVLDVLGVDVRVDSETVEVEVRVADLQVAITPGDDRRLTDVGVHLDTDGDDRPEHLVRADGDQAYGGSTRGWNRLRPGGADEPGAWDDCVPADQPAIAAVLRGSDSVVLTAPRACLGDVSRLRVAVQTYQPDGRAADWVGGVRSWGRTIYLDRP